MRMRHRLERLETAVHGRCEDRSRGYEARCSEYRGGCERRSMDRVRTPREAFALVAALAWRRRSRWQSAPKRQRGRFVFRPLIEALQLHPSTCSRGEIWLRVCGSGTREVSREGWAMIGRSLPTPPAETAQVHNRAGNSSHPSLFIISNHVSIHVERTLQHETASRLRSG